MIFTIIALWGVCLLAITVWWFVEYGFQSRDSKLYLLPWCVMAGVVISTPSVYLIYRGRFDPFHPIVFAAWSYFLPGFFVGGVLLATGYAQPYYLTFVLDETRNLPLTLIYASVAYAFLAIGFAVPVFGRVGKWIGDKLPGWEPRGVDVPIPALLLLAIGASATILAFIEGLFGYQHPEETPLYSGVLFLFSLFWTEGSFLLWLFVFRSRWSTARALIIVGLIAIAVTRAIFDGSRSSLLYSLLLAGFAYVLARGRLTAKQYSMGALLLAFALIAGMLYGTTFRDVKGNQQQVSTADYTAAISNTFVSMSNRDLSSVFVDALDGLASRFDAASSLAVVVSNYEVLAGDEERWGISNNIFVDTVTFLVPRFVWPNKPVGISPETYAQLYFNYGDNSFTITPVGDLLRNFGPWGIPAGMFLLGGGLRFLYAALIDRRSFSFWRAAMYYMMLTSISYEGTYGLLLPFLLRAGATAAVGIILVRVITIFKPSRAQ